LSDLQSIYIHVPFCIKKCGYCDFYSESHLELIPNYIRSLNLELQTRLKSRLQASVQSRLQAGFQTNDRVSTIYFGGGTPSLLPIENIESILKTISSSLRISTETEITLEINPGTIDLNYLKDLNKIGINRLSIGIQSFNDDKLKYLDRIHNSNQAIEAIKHSREAGFTNIGVDLIYGVHKETDKAWLLDLEKVIGFQPEHLSCYMLTLEPGTPLYKNQQNGGFTPLSQDTITDLFKTASMFLNEIGYDHYEISNFSKSLKTRSQHNSNYWKMKPYDGFGPAAHSFDGNQRFWNVSNLKEYIQRIQSAKSPIEGNEILNNDQKKMELIMLGLRTTEGINIKAFNKLFDLSFEEKYQSIMGQVIDESLGFIEEHHFILTLEGRIRLNDIVESFASTIFK
jgi:putative oxygen-independent coproporphyrinogen III oxidase